MCEGELSTKTETERTRRLRGGGGGDKEETQVDALQGRHAPTLAGMLCGSVSNLTLLQSLWQCLPEARTIGQFREIIRQTVPWGSPVQTKHTNSLLRFSLPQLLKWQELCPLYRWEPREVGTHPCHHSAQGQTHPDSRSDLSAS